MSTVSCLNPSDLEVLVSKLGLEQPKKNSPINRRMDTQSDLLLQSGIWCRNLQIAYKITGPEDGPLLVVAGGISANRHVCAQGSAAQDSTLQKPWWPQIVGNNQVVDTLHYRVLTFEFLGGNGETSGPRYRSWKKTAVSTSDQARVLAILLEKLRLPRVEAFIGASYGAMVALSFCQLFPEKIAKAICISGAHRPHPMATAWRHIQREILTLGDPERSIAVARALAMTTYRSPEEFEQRFSDEKSVVSYLKSRGEAYVETMHPEAFRTLSESIDHHCLDVRQIQTPLELIGFRQDRLVPIELLQELERQCPKARLHTFDSIFGHDAFLKEDETIRQALNLTL